MPKDMTPTSPKDSRDMTITCTTQDIWGLLLAIQEQVRQQNEVISHQNDDIKAQTLRNQELDHTIKLHALKLQQQEDTMKTLQSQVLKQGNHITQVTNNVIDAPEGSPPSWAQTMKQEKTMGHMTGEMYTHESMYADEDPIEYKEQEKRSQNIVIRGMQEPKREIVISLNVDVTNLLAEKLGMQDAGVYGAHRAGKKRTDAHRAVVCTMLDARKRTIILENARFYLKGTEYYGSAMISMMNSMQLVAMNGAIKFIHSGSYTCYTASHGRSTNDYALVRYDALDLVHHFEVGSMLPTSDHTPIHICLCMPSMPIVNTMNTPNRPYKMQLTKKEDYASLLDSLLLDRNMPCDIEETWKIFRHAMEEVTRTIMGKYQSGTQIRKGLPHNPWFDAKCKEAKCKMRDLSQHSNEWECAPKEYNTLTKIKRRMYELSKEQLDLSRFKKEQRKLGVT
ncbi:hypothetical protein L7F22_069404 [Adiantum nelumboides]|nr:hypothetical protein [Adiantum nelumboides]